MQPTLNSALVALNDTKRRSRILGRLLKLLRVFVLGAVAVSIWAIVRPQQELEQLALGALVVAIGLIAGLASRRRESRITLHDLALALEMRHGPATTSALRSDMPGIPVPPDWAPHLDAEVQDLRRYETTRLLALASTLVLPLAVSFVTLPSAAPSLKLAFKEVSNVVSSLTRGATLKVVQGAATENDSKEIELSTRKVAEVELLAQNLIEVKVTGGGFGKSAPTVELRRRPDPEATAEGQTPPPGIFQSFQMMPVRDAGRAPSPASGTSDSEATRHAISFAVSEPVDLYIPAIDSGKPLAHIKVRQLPVPKVKLTITSKLEDPWPDDQPLGLRIEVRAENPLQTVRLLIKSGQRTSKELVANVMAEDKLKLDTDYRLLLEQYVESDLAEVEIVAEAIDRSLPTPLAGYSEPVQLRTASAYGRYRQTLQTLRELKQHVDKAIEKQETKLPQEAEELASKAQEQSEKSPFFDGLDRVQINRFDQRLQELKRESGESAEEPAGERMMELSQSLNDFLFEHEILDDRERDRDFFVAVRGLSRLIEQEPGKRPVGVRTVTERLRKFLDDRTERWTRRVARIPAEAHPPQTRDVLGKKPFNGTMDRIDQLDGESKAGGATGPQAKADQLTALSKAVVEYRTWIEALESAEDKSREQEERKRQEGLANARDTMRELQQRQGEISQELDRAGERQQSELDAQWPTSRMKQNANTKETRRLESQLRSLSPQAGNRIQAAVQAMEATGEYGNSGNYQLAESSSDLAGRLLRQAERAASQSQQKRRDRGRRRRVTGDNYYGQSVVGGDIEIKREYQVDRRYREDILDEVQGSAYDEESRALLESYLRQVIR